MICNVIFKIQKKIFETTQQFQEHHFLIFISSQNVILTLFTSSRLCGIKTTLGLQIQAKFHVIILDLFSKTHDTLDSVCLMNIICLRIFYYPYIVKHLFDKHPVFIVIENRV